MDVLTQLGRLPDPCEYPNADTLVATFGSLPRAFALVRRITGDETWDQIARRRREDLLVFLALSRFRRRPRVSDLPDTLRRDIRAFFGAYTRACHEADELLFKAGNADAVDEACRGSVVGKLLPNALYVHRTALPTLGPLLRVYEGCARAYLGDVHGANLLKLHRFSGKVSYLMYPTFDTDAHPALARSVKLSLRTRELDIQDYAASENPPVLHRKETFLAPDHPLREQFARLTRQEEEAGLLDDTATIGTRNGWSTRLAERGHRVRGHQLVRVKPVK
jgi:DNA phosphorothioation-associated putative methyltransferase